MDTGNFQRDLSTSNLPKNPAPHLWRAVFSSGQIKHEINAILLCLVVLLVTSGCVPVFVTPTPTIGINPSHTPADKPVIYPSETIRSKYTPSPSYTPIRKVAAAPPHTPSPTAISPTSSLTPSPLPPSPTFTPPPSLYIPARGNVPRIEALNQFSAQNASSIGRLVTWGLGRILQVELSSGGRSIFVRSTRGMGAYDARTLEERWFRDMITGQFAISPDGSQIALPTRRGLEIWQASDGTFLRRFEISGWLCLTIEECNWPPPNTAFSPDGRVLAAMALSDVASSRDARKIWLWNMPGGDLMRIAEGQGDVKDMAFSPDGAILALRRPEAIELWLIQDWSLLRVMAGSGARGMVESYSFSPDGKQLAARYSDTAFIWNIADGALSAVVEEKDLKSFNFELWWLLGEKSLNLSPPEGMVMDVSPDGGSLGVYSESAGIVQIWDITRDSSIRRINTGWLSYLPEGKTPLLFTSDGDGILTFASNGLRLWSVADGRLLRSNLWGEEGAEINQVSTFTPDGQYLLGQGWSGSYLIRVQDGAVAGASNGLLTFLPGEGIIELRQTGEDIDLIHLHERSLFQKLTGTGQVIYSKASPDGSLMVTCASPYNQLVLWRAKEGSRIQSLDIGWFTNAVFSPDSTLLATSGGQSGERIFPDSATIRLWRTLDGSLTNTLTVEGGEVLAFTPDGTRLAVNSASGGIRLFRVADMAVLATFTFPDRFQGRPAKCSSAVLSSDGSSLVCGTQNGKLIFWRISDGVVLNEIQAHSGQVLSLSSSPDGKVIASGSTDDTVRLWGIAP
jgi:WD40 repeat protein